MASVVYADADFNLTRTAGVVLDDPDDDTGKSLKGQLLTVGISNADLFIGTGAELDTVSTSATYGEVTLPASTDPAAVGFFAENGALDLAIFTASHSVSGTTETALSFPHKYTGLQASLGRAGLQGIDAVELIATDLSLKLNRSAVTTRRPPLVGGKTWVQGYCS